MHAGVVVLEAFLLLRFRSVLIYIPLCIYKHHAQDHMHNTYIRVLISDVEMHAGVVVLEAFLLLRFRSVLIYIPLCIYKHHAQDHMHNTYIRMYIG